MTAQLRLSGESNGLAALRREYPGRDILLVDSGTSALLLALRASRSDNAADDRPPVVAVPAFCCPDVGSAALGAGFRIALYDLDPYTLAPDLTSLERVFRAGATHVVAVHFFGRIVDIAAIDAMAAPYGAVVIEDAAQHAGGTLHGERGGSLGRYGILSFGRGKGLNAGGGGALVFHPPTTGPGNAPSLMLAGGAGRGWRVLAQVAAAEWLSHPRRYWMPAAIPSLQLGKTVYHPPREPRSIPPAAAALIAAALAGETEARRVRRQNESWYLQHLHDRPDLLVRAPAPGMESGALRFPVRMSSAHAQGWQSRGVVRSYPQVLSDYRPIAEHCVPMTGSLHGAMQLARTLHTLPTHERITERDREDIVRHLLRHPKG